MDITKKITKLRNYEITKFNSVIKLFSNSVTASEAKSERSDIRAKRGFTLIELLIVIAIIAILIGVLVPSMSRSLSGNRLASDVEVLRAKIEETRILAGSTQTNDEPAGLEKPNTDRVGYYGIYIPPKDIIEDHRFLPEFYAIVRLSYPVTEVGSGYCDGVKAADDARNNNISSDSCLIERVNLTNGIAFDALEFYNARYRIIGFRVPSQQTAELFCKAPCGTVGGVTNPWQENTAGPQFDKGGTDGKYFKLKYNNKTATVKIEPYTGKLIVVYN